MTFPKIVRRKFYQSFKLTVGEVVFLKYRIAWDFVPYISRYTTSLTQSAWRRVELRVRLAINLVSQFITLDQPVTTWLYDLCIGANHFGKVGGPKKNPRVARIFFWVCPPNNWHWPPHFGHYWGGQWGGHGGHKFKKLQTGRVSCYKNDDPIKGPS